MLTGVAPSPMTYGVGDVGVYSVVSLPPAPLSRRVSEVDCPADLSKDTQEPLYHPPAGVAEHLDCRACTLIVQYRSAS